MADRAYGSDTANESKKEKAEQGRGKEKQREGGMREKRVLEYGKEGTRKNSGTGMGVLKSR